MDEKIVEIAMQLIFYAGNAKSETMRAISAAEAGEITQAEELLTGAKEQLHDAHQIQTDLITQEMNDTVLEKPIILIHAQDHFIGAVTSIDLGEKMIQLNRRLQKIEEKLKEVSN